MMSYPQASADGFAEKRRRRPLGLLELVTVIHLIVLLGATTWAFGGQADFVRPPLTIWATLSVFIVVAALLRSDDSDSRKRALMWLLPMAGFNLLVLVGTFHPSLRELHFGSEAVLAPQARSVYWPSSAAPDLARNALWVFDVYWLACFNVTLVVRRRRAIRAILIFGSFNALALSVFGTIQKLAHSKGIYFDSVPTRQIYFFASFVYHNHWGSFALLMLASGLALLWYFGRRRTSRDIFHSPASAILVMLLLVAATIPLSGSRSTTLLLIAFSAGTAAHWLIYQVRKRRYLHESLAVPILLITVGASLAGAAIWFVGRDTITARFRMTERQLVEFHRIGSIGSRVVLYRDTIEMGMAKPWFGWGMASYPQVFIMYNTQVSGDRLPVFYHDAHSDWLQAFAEHGVCGTLVLALGAIIPLVATGAKALRNAVSGYLLTGCTVVLLYALVEFPFGNLAVLFCWWLCYFCAVQYARLRDSGSGGASLVAPDVA